MSDWLSVAYVLQDKLAEPDRASLLEFCFEELDCARSPPDETPTDELRYIVDRSTNELVTEASIAEATEQVAAVESGTIWFWYDELEVGVHINSFNHQRPDVPTVSISISSWFIDPYRDNESSLVYDFIHKLYNYLDPIYVYGNTHLDESSLSREGIMNGRLEDVFWVNGFSPELVDAIGRDRLLDAPVWRVDECDDGGIFLWLLELPHSQGRDEKTNELRAYFDLELPEFPDGSVVVGGNEVQLPEEVGKSVELDETLIVLLQTLGRENIPDNVWAINEAGDIEWKIEQASSQDPYLDLWQEDGELWTYNKDASKYRIRKEDGQIIDEISMT